jgi:Carboxypeptidase regulatory-like domain/TonB dependent receptor-like, beta-barrel
MNVRNQSWVSCLVVLASVLILLARARPALAQATGGVAVLTGTVTDAASKKPLADVVVTATSPAAQGEQVVVTDSAGYYRIPELPSGTYALKLEKDGYQPYVREGFALRTDATLRANAELLPTTITGEEVVVQARAPTVDVGSSSVGANINSDFTSRVAIAPPSSKGTANRSIESVAEVTPGARGDTYGVSFAGTTSPENSYIVDGLNVGSPGTGLVGLSLSSEFVKEISVITGGYMPEYGRTMGGMVQATTKTGSNEFHGNVFSFYTPGALSPTPKPTYSAGSTVSTNTPISFIGDFGADIGGPIKKDKLWFYTGFDFATTNYNVDRTFNYLTPDGMGGFVNDQYGNPVVTPIPGASERRDATMQQLQAIAKLTWAINPNNTATATFIAAPSWTGGGTTCSGNDLSTCDFSKTRIAIDPRTGIPDLPPGASGTASAIARQLNTQAYDASVKWSTEFANKRVLIDTTIGWHHEEDDFLPSDGSQPASGKGLSTVPNIFWSSAFNPVSAFENLPALKGPQCFPQGMPGPTNQMATVACPAGQYYSGGAWNQISIQKYDRYQLGSTATYLLQALGHHVVKVGFNFEYTTVDDLKDHSGGSNYLEVVGPDGKSQYVVDNEQFGVLIGRDNARLAPFHVHAKSLIAGGFVQDSWSVMDLVTANVGVRYDAQELYGGNGQLGMSLPNEWSPRVGVIYDPTQQGRAKLFANYALYYENVPISLASGTLTPESGALAVHPSPLAPGFNPATTCDVRVYPYCGGATNSPGTHLVGVGAYNAPQSPSQQWRGFQQGANPVDSQIQPTSTNDFVAGGEYEILKNARAGVSWQHRWINRWIEDFSRDNLRSFAIGNPGYGTAGDFPKAERIYDAVTLYFMKAFADDWLTSASYTISYLRGNIAGLYKTSNAELDPNHNADFDLKTYTINTWGPLDGDHTHDIKVFGAKDWVLAPIHRLSTGLTFRAISGLPISFYGADVAYGQGINLLLPRGSGGRTPWNYDVDMNLGYRFSIDKDKSITFTVDIFNLINFQDAQKVDEQYTLAPAVQGKTPNFNGNGNSNGNLTTVRVVQSDGTTLPLYAQDKNQHYLQPIQYQPPRYFRFGIRGTF